MPARPHLQKLVQRVRLLPPLQAAVVFPCDPESLQVALTGAFAGYLAPTLIGPELRIREVAESAGLDITRLPIVDTGDAPSAASVRAAALAHGGEIQALIRGTLSNEELLGAVVDPDSGLRGECRLSHAYFIDLPGHSRALVLGDAYMNVNPNLAAKRDIVLNTVRLAVALGIDRPRVALLAAMDRPASAFPSTAEALALRSMASQGMFDPAIVDGPLAPDSALSTDAARANGVASEVAGLADVLIGPSMESSLMVLRTLLAMGSGLAAGVILGARIPIVAHARNEPMEVHMASCVLASLMRASTPSLQDRRSPPVTTRAHERTDRISV